MARKGSDNIVPLRHGHGRYPAGTPGGPDRAAALRPEAFLRDLQADWEQHGKDILEVMRKKQPEIYFQCMVKLALVQGTELDQPTFERQHTPEEIIAKLEERVGAEGRRLFENFLRKGAAAGAQRQSGLSSVPSMHTDAVERTSGLG
jgi:hypothetical protein